VGHGCICRIHRELTPREMKSRKQLLGVDYIWQMHIRSFVTLYDSIVLSESWDTSDHRPRNTNTQIWQIKPRVGEIWDLVKSVSIISPLNCSRRRYQAVNIIKLFWQRRFSEVQAAQSCYQESATSLTSFFACHANIRFHWKILVEAPLLVIIKWWSLTLSRR